MSTIKSGFISEYGILAYVHHLIFPLDLMYSDDDEWLARREMKINELTPILIWLMPLILLLTNTVSFTGFALALFLALEAFVIAFLSLIMTSRWTFSTFVDLFLNYCVSFLLLGIALFSLMFLYASCGLLIAIGIIILIVTKFANYDSY